MISAPSNSGKRNRRACTTCRQVKLRCDSVQTFPGPCSRCKQNNLQCRTDPDFKRMRSRNRLKEVTSQLAAIQRTLGIQPSDSSPESYQSQSESPGNPPLSLKDSLTVDAWEDAEGSRPPFFQHSSPSSTDPSFTVKLGQLELQHYQITELFEHFNLNYYRHCPILETSMTLSALQCKSPILFWTIVIISIRWIPSLSYLYDMILENYKNLLGHTLLESIDSIETIQAVVMLCFWPLSVERQPDDPSWSYCGMITNAAMKMDMHQLPGADIAKSGHTEKQIKAGRMTWLACVHANCWHGWKVRVAVSSEVLTSSLTIAQPLSKIERDFVAQVQTLRQFSKSASTIAQMNAGLSAWAFVQTLCKEIENLQVDFGNSWTAETELIVLGTQLGLYALQLERGQSPKRSISGNRELETSRKTFINLAFITAARLITTFSDMLEGATKVARIETFVPQRGLPKHYFGLLLLAAFFIFKVRVHHAQDVKASEALSQTHIQLVYQIFAAWSLDKMDEPGRVLRLIGVLLRAETQSQLKFKESSANKRPGVNIVTDVISTAKTLRKTEEKISQSAHVQASNEHNIDTPIEVGNISGFADNFASLEDFQDSLMEWNFPWDLEMPTAEQYEFGTNDMFSHD